ncbi:ParB/RepB/Spo0J family partition protein [Jatrophihabitans cynanchi]|uniref:ParB/RepB/Spo0J family partition protein n=1 Tax=Jatrophihabitans cynanchi TaxID=2944128 RepID=A0ABY7JRR9_9ACTN|nr:ParB/RepB/Spo0J family partition protein [Jatrophihabitans sp. SB3-54]WAX55254.1 ParB/RepB/Spo0J family partition protein [Jatrophihabitans sp. SB3-54]
MSNKNRRGGLGRGLGALIPTAPPVVEPADALAPAGSATDSAERPGPDGFGAGATVAVPDPAMPESPAGEAAHPAVESAVESATASEAMSGDHMSGDHMSGDHTSGHNGAVDVEPGATLLPVAGASFAELPIERIHANAKQPRQVFDEDALAELTHSVREFGVLQPVVVRPDSDGYELVMGERRLRAAEAAGLTVVPAIIRSTADDAMLRDALLENIHRAQLNPLEEAAAYQQLLEEFGTTHDELAARIGRSRPQVTNTIRLLNLSIPVQRRVAAGVLSAGHARALLGLQDTEAQDELASRIVAEGLSVRATEEQVALHASGAAGKKPGRHAPTHRMTAPAINELADKLSDAFDTRVRVELGRRKGKITVEFASVDDLERIIAVMAPQLSPRRRTEAQPAANEP